MNIKDAASLGRSHFQLFNMNHLTVQQDAGSEVANELRPRVSPSRAYNSSYSVSHHRRKRHQPTINPNRQLMQAVRGLPSASIMEARPGRVPSRTKHYDSIQGTEGGGVYTRTASINGGYQTVQSIRSYIVNGENNS